MTIKNGQNKFISLTDRLKWKLMLGYIFVALFTNLGSDYFFKKNFGKKTFIFCFVSKLFPPSLNIYIGPPFAVVHSSLPSSLSLCIFKSILSLSHRYFSFHCRADTNQYHTKPDTTWIKHGKIQQTPITSSISKLFHLSVFF